jgi:adenosylmethionine-8-amino-7-oxononanoate aminotransferase
MITMAKGLSSGYAPIGAVAVNPSVFQPFTAKDRPFGHLLTFGGHAVAAAAACRNVEIIANEELVRQSAEKGTYLLDSLQELRERHPTIADVRGLGLMAGIEHVKGKQSKETGASSIHSSRRSSTPFTRRAC